MKQIRCKQHTPHGLSEIHLRVINSIVYMKFQRWSSQADHMVKTMEDAGAIIEKGEKDWVKIDLFGDNQVGKLGDVVIDLKNDNVDEIELALIEFFKKKYKDAKYTVEDLSPR